ncbi:MULTISPECIES: hypothetical protein [unclassified Campylobacter]|uniref:hypothetical protein n=1 Tax=unclassified Campylobacter TaxID=2593542 RepID=UPI001237FB18|nr:MULTISPECIES: hypothetical protein [unclassified Campylobacter]KAA6224662.1 hypothetical protein FMM54_07365 [Campylobacter sp. LR185c]KAA6225662.1 hypothetical protein FMM57_07160 [Campylobacter sp. LR286c]KAA6225782.1 hypothetical protein FMM55_05825 [Campylobacter sp. LR196d]KAA6229635.1 hypothetical protein FMM58_06915 [Campylobacter sp. LR291e]KAA6230120.1 hypothetical protein FMM56_06875 [Campylobacter sp. LR264d]
MTHVQKEELVKNLKNEIGKEFVLSSDEDNLYCTTLLEKAIKPFLNFDLNYSHVQLLIFRGKYLYPKASYDDNNSVLIYKFKD